MSANTTTTTSPSTSSPLGNVAPSLAAPPDEGGGGGEGGGAGGDESVVYLSYDDEFWDDKDSSARGAEDDAAAASPPEEAPLNSSVAGGGGGVGGGAEDDLLLLGEANGDLVSGLVPVLVLLALVLLLTLLGNALVCLVYRSRFRRNSANHLVVFLAGLEMVVVGVGVPLEMAVVALPVLFRSRAACRAARYAETASVCAVLLVLTAVAVDRYLKMSRPANFLSQKWMRGLCVGTVVAALVLALPSLFVFGSRAVEVEVGMGAGAGAGGGVRVVRGVACDVDDAMQDSPARFVYVGVLLVTFTGAVLTKAVLYVLMFVRICRRKTANHRGEKVSPARREYPRKHRFVTEDSISSCGGGAGGEESRRLPTASSSSGSSGIAGGAASVRSGRSSPGVDPARVPLKSTVKESARIGQGASTTLDVQSNRMTWIFFLVTLLTLLTLLPFLAFRVLLVLWDVVMQQPPQALQPPRPLHMLYQLGLRLYLLHAPLIPLLYLCCNHNLRREARHLVRNSCWGCKRRPTAPPASNGAPSAAAHAAVSDAHHHPHPHHHHHHHQQQHHGVHHTHSR